MCLLIWFKFQETSTCNNVRDNVDVERGAVYVLGKQIKLLNRVDSVLESIISLVKIFLF